MKAQADAQKQVEMAVTTANKQIADLAIMATEKLLGRELAKNGGATALRGRFPG